MTAYILEKFLPALERDLLFKKYAPVLPPQPWYRRLRWAFRWYFTNLYQAMKGQERG